MHTGRTKTNPHLEQLMFLSWYDGNPCEWTLNKKVTGTPGMEAAIREVCRLNGPEDGQPCESPVGPISFGGTSSVYWMACGWGSGPMWLMFLIFSKVKLSEEECSTLLKANLPEGFDDDGEGDEEYDEFL